MESIHYSLCYFAILLLCVLLSCLMATTLPPVVDRGEYHLKTNVLPNYLHALNYGLRRRRSPDQRYKKKLNSFHHKNNRNSYAVDNYKNDYWSKNNYNQQDENELFEMSSEAYHKPAFNKGFSSEAGSSISPTLELVTKTVDGNKHTMDQITYNSLLSHYNKLLDNNRRYDSYDTKNYNSNYPSPAHQQQSHNSYMSSYYPSKDMLLGLLKPILIPILLLFLFNLIAFLLSSSSTPVIVQQQQQQQADNNNNNNNDIVVIVINATGKSF